MKYLTVWICGIVKLVLLALTVPIWIPFFIMDEEKLPKWMEALIDWEIK